MLKQLSIFTENKKGAMLSILTVLADAGINILASVTNDSAEYGIVRMLVSDPELAVRLLTAEGYLCRTGEVLGVELADEPGALKQFLAAIADINVNVDYIYLSYNRANGRPVLVIHCASIQEVELSLISRGFSIIS